MANIKNIPIKKYRKFLKSEGCELNRTKGGHEHWTRVDLDRPLTFQSHVTPPPAFVIRQHIKYLNISKEEFLTKIDNL